MISEQYIYPNLIDRATLTSIEIELSDRPGAIDRFIPIMTWLARRSDPQVLVDFLA